MFTAWYICVAHCTVPSVQWVKLLDSQPARDLPVVNKYVRELCLILWDFRHLMTSIFDCVAERQTSRPIFSFPVPLGFLVRSSNRRDERTTIKTCNAA